MGLQGEKQVCYLLLYLALPFKVTLYYWYGYNIPFMDLNDGSFEVDLSPLLHNFALQDIKLWCCPMKASRLDNYLLGSAWRIFVCGN